MKRIPYFIRGSAYSTRRLFTPAFHIQVRESCARESPPISHVTYSHLLLTPARWHAPSSRHLRALLSVYGRCSSGGLGCFYYRVFRCRGCCSLSLSVCVCVCVCDLLICSHLLFTAAIHTQVRERCCVSMFL